MASGRIAFRLRLGPLAERDAVVRRVEGQEGLSQPYAFRVDFAPASGESLELADLLGQEAVLRMARPTGEERIVHGEAARVELVEVAARKPRYRATLAPRLSRLSHVVRSRTYQGKTVPEIVQAVLGEHRVQVRSDLSGSYAQREYVVQHRETDLAFVSRLLEGEGIWYRFEHADDGHTLVLGDASGAWAATGLRLPVRRETGQEGGTEQITELGRESGLVVGKVTRRDYDFTRPQVDLTVQAAAQGDLEVYEWPGGYRESSQGKRGAQARLEGLRFGEEWFSGKSNAVGVEPGAKLEVEGRGNLAVVRVVHRASQETAAGASGGVTAGYENAFVAVEASRPYRPRRRWKKPLVSGIETAMVVGPAGEEIHTDAYGRVRVQFHWDREGKKDDTSSCWVRLAQAWAGAGMGASFVPRIGQEVVVRFLEGDPDRPLVTGAVYDGSNAPPLQLPGEKTRSTLRTATSPGSGGSNELRIEDGQGQEEIWLHAQKDEAIEVGNDRAREVRANERVGVQQDRTQQVLGKQELRVALLDATEVGGNQALDVAADRRTAVAASHQEAVAGNQAVTIAGNRSVQVFGGSVVFIGAAGALNVGGAYAVNVAGVYNQAVGGLKSTQVGGAAVEWVGASREEAVGGDRSASAGGDFQGEVDGNLTAITDQDASDDVGGAEGIEVKEALASLAKQFDFSATDKLSIVVGGKVALTMEKSGNVTLAGNAITLDGSDMKLKGAQIQKVAAGSAQGQQVKVQQLARTSDPRAFVSFTLMDQDGKPVANEPFQVELPDGTVKRGKTDGGGGASIPGSKRGTAKVTFTGLDGKSVEEKK